MATDTPTTKPTIKLLRPGSFTAVDGTKVTFTRADLAGMAASYDASSDPAPLVIGHPKMDAPAYGWIGGLAMVGDELVATPSTIAPAFAEVVRDGHYRKVSGQFYPPRHPGNPKPDGWYLQHVGFLGAAAPAIKGLGTVAFAAADDDALVTITLDTQETPMTDTPTDTVAFAERESALVIKETDLAAKESDLVEREAALIAAERLATHNGNVAFAEGQIERGVLAPAGRDLVVGLLDTLSASAVVSFGEATGELPPADALRRLFDGAQPIVSFGEAAPADTPPVDLDTRPEELAGKAVAFVESERVAGRTVTIQAAVRHVHKGA